MLSEAEASHWLNSDAEQADLLALCRSRIVQPLAVVPVSSRVNNARYKGASCLEAVGEAKHLPAVDDGKHQC